jgi:peptidoglycan-associated lipoprotein
MIKNTLPFLFTALFIAGCSSTGNVQQDEAANRQAAMPPAVVDDSQTAGIGDNLGPDGRPFGSNPNAALIPVERIIYFDFDSSQLRPDAEALLQAHAAYLGGNPGMIVRLEGHADERGSREYNLALGERRANAAKRMLVILGVAESQMTTLSYGEEMPLSFGHNEGSWQQNRRVEIVYP